jgi:hypothetical protein
MPSLRARPALVLWLSLLGCTQDLNSGDGGMPSLDSGAQGPDAGFRSDAEPGDQGPLPIDSGAPVPDAGFADAGAPPEDSGLASDAGVLTPDSGLVNDAGVLTPDSGQSTDAGFLPLSLSSPSIAAGGAIPARHACGGVDLQPQLDFANIPIGAQSLALVLIDDSINYVHWIALDIPPTTVGLAEAASDNGMLPAGTREIPAYGTQYRGPCPPNVHTYTFRLYALSVAQTTYNWPGSVLRAANLTAAFGANTLAEARLTGTYTP